MDILQACDLKKTYGTGEACVHALDGVSLNVEKGEFVAIVGTSGSGKSTLLHMLGGLDRPSSGKVFVDGKDIFSLKDEELTIFRRRKIGFVFQAYNLVPVLNVYENIVLPIELDGGKVDKEFVKKITETLGLDQRLDALPNQLSGGQQQRVAIARALAAEPAIILADEPTGNLDGRTSQDVLGLLKVTSQKFSQTIVMITHNEEIAQLADRIIRIEDGHIVEMEKSKKILKVENLKKAYYSTSRTGESITYPVLNNVSFEIEEGEFVGIMGRSGCGKTTLLKAVGMLDKPDDGTIYYKDKDTKDIYRAELARLRRTEIAFVFQDYYLMDSLSIKENIMLPLILDEADVQESKKKCEEMAEKFAITDLLDKKPYELSGGEKQRTAICRALIYNPDLILADEPTGNLDSASSEVVIHTLEEINKKMGKTILLVTHDPIIASSCDRIIFLKDGKVKEDLKRTGDKEQFYNEIITNWC